METDLYILNQLNNDYVMSVQKVMRSVSIRYSPTISNVRIRTSLTRTFL